MAGPGFRWVSLAKTQDNWYRIEWDIYSNPVGTHYTVDDFNFKILYSHSPASEFEYVKDANEVEVVIDGMMGNSFVHERVQYDFDKKRYYKVEAEHKTDTDITFESEPTFIGATYDGIHQAMAYTEDLLYDHYIGEPSLVVIRKSTGSRCPECWSFERQQMIKSHCETCDSTGFVDGYYRPIPIQISYDSEEKKSLPEQTGENVLDEKKARLSNYPLVKPKDLILSRDTYKRYVITHVNTTKLPLLSKNRDELSRQNHVVSQILTLQEINPDDNEYFANLGDIVIPDPIPGDYNQAGGRYPWFIGHSPVTADPPIYVDGQHLTFRYETSQFELRNGVFTLQPTAWPGGSRRIERSELSEDPVGVFETPDFFVWESLLVFRNGQMLSTEADNGITIIDNKTFTFKTVIDRTGVGDDDITAYYIPVST